MNQIKVPQAKTSGIDQKAMRDSLKLETRFVVISEIVIRRKKMNAIPIKGKYHVISSLHLPPSTT